MSNIGHNNPPKDREVEWKSISINIWDYKSLLEIAQNILLAIENMMMENTATFCLLKILKLETK